MTTTTAFTHMKVYQGQTGAPRGLTMCAAILHCERFFAFWSHFIFRSSFVRETAIIVRKYFISCTKLGSKHYMTLDTQVPLLGYLVHVYTARTCTCTRSTWHASVVASARQGRRERNCRRGRWVQRRLNDGGHDRCAERGGDEGGGERSGVHAGGAVAAALDLTLTLTLVTSRLPLAVAVAAAGAGSTVSRHHRHASPAAASVSAARSAALSAAIRALPCAAASEGEGEGAPARAPPPASPTENESRWPWW